MLPAGRAVRWLSVLAWMGLISYWSAQSDLPIDHPRVASVLRGQQHVLAHLAAYAVLGALLRWALDGARLASVWAWMVAALFGLADEWHQGFTPGRAVEVGDWLADAAAAATMVGAADLLLRGRPWASWQRLAPVPRLAFAAVLVAGVALAARPHLPPARAVAQRAAAVLERSLPQPVDAYAAGVGRSTLRAASELRRELRERLSG